MTDRGRTETLVANERFNAVSRAFMNLGTALLAAAAARVYVNGDVDGTALFWLLGVIVLMFSGLKVLYLLDAENDR